MTFWRSLAGLTAVILAVAACSSSVTSNSSAAPSLAPTSTAAPSVVTPATPSPTPQPTATPTAAPTPTATPPKGDVTITAQGIAFTTPAVTAPAGKPFTIAFQNKAVGIPHNVHISTLAGANIFKGAIVTGPVTAIYKVPAMKAGAYPFICDVHPAMKGTLTVR